MPSSDFVVSLRIFSKTHDLSIVSEELGLKPKYQHKIGTPRMAPDGSKMSGVHVRNHCSYDLNRQGEESLIDVLNRTIDYLIPFKHVFHSVKKTGGGAEFLVGWHHQNNSGIVFDCDLLTKLAELKIDLALNVYELE